MYASLAMGGNTKLVSSNGRRCAGAVLNGVEMALRFQQSVISEVERAALIGTAFRSA